MLDPIIIHSIPPEIQDDACSYNNRIQYTFSTNSFVLEIFESSLEGRVDLGTSTQVTAAKSQCSSECRSCRTVHNRLMCSQTRTRR